jgi:23S rRNA pseudouridine1911/1915/1917 synthase
MLLEWTIEAGEERATRRLGRFLYSEVGSYSRLYLRTRMLGGYCRVNGLIAGPGKVLRPGDRVTLEVDADARTAMSPEAMALEVLWEDPHLLAVNKPAGLLVHPSRMVKSGTLLNGVVHHCGPGVRPGLPHRLDQATSGVLTVTKTQEALSGMSQLFQRRQVEKRYLALVEGHPEAGDIEAPIGRRGGIEPPWNVYEEGKAARSRLWVVERRDGEALVELEPVTGRTNQLRIHCAYVGHPIVGDRWYGGRAAERLMLHAWVQRFRHPVTGEAVRIEAPPPVPLRVRVGERP